MGFPLLRLGWLFVFFQWVWGLPAMNAIRDGGRLPDGTTILKRVLVRLDEALY